MTDTIFVVPAPVGEDELPRIVRHPARGFAILPPEGDEWPAEDVYTAARLRDGDVVEGERPVAASEPQVGEADGIVKTPIEGLAGGSLTELRTEGPGASEPHGRRRP